MIMIADAMSDEPVVGVVVFWCLPSSDTVVYTGLALILKIAIKKIKMILILAGKGLPRYILFQTF